MNEAKRTNSYPLESGIQVRHDLLGGDEEHEVLGAKQRCAEESGSLDQVAFLGRGGDTRNEVVSSQALHDGRDCEHAAVKRERTCLRTSMKPGMSPLKRNSSALPLMLFHLSGFCFMCIVQPSCSKPVEPDAEYEEPAGM